MFLDCDSYILKTYNHVSSQDTYNTIEVRLMS